MSSNPESQSGVVAAVALAVLLRAPHALVRWEETAWRYAGYPAETLAFLRAGDVGGLAGTFTGLHPPLWPLLHSALEVWAPVPLLWLALGVACSVGAVALTAREHPWAGLLLAASPLQVHYCAEINQYPLALLWVALAWHLAGRRRGFGLAVVVALAGWTHLLGGLVAALATLRLKRGSAKVLGIAGVLLLPLAWPVVSVLGEASTFRQPAFSAAQVVADWQARFGLAGLGVVGLAVLGILRRPRVAVGVVGSLVVLGGLVAARIAAPHQFPYFVFVGPPLALLAAAGLPTLGRGSRVALGVLVGVLAVGGVRVDAAALGGVVADPPRGIDLARAELEQPWTCQDAPTVSCSGDALILLSPPGINDDDKRQHSATLWRLRPWNAMPQVVPPGIDWGSHRQGHPRLVDGHVVYVLDHPREELALMRQAHERVWLVVYDQGRHRAYTTDLAGVLKAAPVEVAGDHVYRLSSFTTEADNRVVHEGPDPG